MKRLQLNRIDESGVFTLPNGAPLTNVMAIEVDGIYLTPEEYVITSNGNVDIIQAIPPDSVVTAVIDHD
jgi:hypothetical protein